MEFMVPRFAAVVCLIVLGLAVSGCTRCGFWWDDLGHSCHSDTVH